MIHEPVNANTSDCLWDSADYSYVLFVTFNYDNLASIESGLLVLLVIIVRGSALSTVKYSAVSCLFL
jgi:hypothetical protein